MASGGLGLPDNWSQVEQKASRVDKVNPGEINDVARQFDEASRSAGDNTAALNNAAAPLQEGVWSGPAADKFFAYVESVAQAGNRVKDKLDEAATELTSLQETLADIKRQIQSAKEHAHEEITKRNQTANSEAAAAEDPGQAEEIRNAARQANRTTAGETARRIDELMRQANEAIQRAQQLMKTEIDGGGFSQVSPPSGGTSQMQSTGGISGGDGGSGGGASGGGASGGGGAAGGVGSSGGPPASGPPPGNVEQWITEAIRVLQQNGIPVSEENIDQIWTIIQHESGGDPHAINDWDSNAAKGTPSKGLMQCIDPTFDAHALPGHGDIWNPVDNIVAGVNYTFDRYGSLEGHPGLSSIAQGGGYEPY